MRKTGWENIKAVNILTEKIPHAPVRRFWENCLIQIKLGIYKKLATMVRCLDLIKAEGAIHGFNRQGWAFQLKRLSGVIG